MQLLELRLLRIPISGYFQSVRIQSSCFHNTREVSRKTNVAESHQRDAVRKFKEQLLSRMRFVCLSSVWPNC